MKVTIKKVLIFNKNASTIIFGNLDDTIIKNLCISHTVNNIWNFKVLIVKTDIYQHHSINHCLCYTLDMHYYFLFLIGKIPKIYGIFHI